MLKKLSLLFILMLSWATVPPMAAQADETDDAQLGVMLQDLNSELRRSFKFDGDGVLISDIIEDSGADDAGLKSGDIIIEFNGSPVASTEKLIGLVKKARVGDKVKVKIKRDGDAKTVEVTMKKRDRDTASRHAKKMIIVTDDRPWLGIQMQDLSGQLAAYFKAESGVLVSEVMDNSPAQKAGVKAGDVIVGWNGEKIADMDDLYDELEDAKAGDEIKLQVVRTGQKQDLKVTVIEAPAKKERDIRVFGFGGGDNDDEDDMPFFRWHGHKPPMAAPFMDDHIREFRFENKERDKELDALKDELKQLREELRELKSSLKK